MSERENKLMPESGLFLDGATIGLIITNAGLIVKMFIDKRNNKKNEKPCNEHGNRLTALETNQNNTIKAIDVFAEQNRNDHEKIFDILRNKP